MEELKLTFVMVGPRDGAAQSLGASLNQRNISCICVLWVENALAAFAKAKPRVLVIDSVAAAKHPVASLLQARQTWPETKIVWIGPLPAAEKDVPPLLDFYFKDVELPQAKARAAGILARLSQNAGASDPILVIDDSKTYRAIGQNALEKAGFPTTAVDSMEAALELMRLVRFRGVLTDVFMDGMGGIEGIHHLRGARPDLAVVAMSGGLDERMQSDKALLAASRIGANRTILKPFEAEALATVMREALAEAQAH